MWSKLSTPLSSARHLGELKLVEVRGLEVVQIRQVLHPEFLHEVRLVGLRTGFLQPVPEILIL